MTKPRLHLVAPADINPDQIADCAEAACAAGDAASILIQPARAKALVTPLQRLGLAVLIAGDPQVAMANSADGVEIAGLEALREARRILGPDRVVGAFCGTSRHRAMELAEAGADYVAFAQEGRLDLISWWSEIFEIPCIAVEPVTAVNLDILLPHNPDFIRPDDAMWTSPEAARDIIEGLTARLTG